MKTRANQEYDKWCALERAHENRFGEMEQKCYVAGFNKAVLLMEEYLKGNRNEIIPQN